MWQGNAAWTFVPVPKKESAAIKAKFAKVRRGFGSVRVAATIGQTTWLTSIFPDSKSGQYVLPLKAAVRQKVGIRAGDTIAFSLKIQ